MWILCVSSVRYCSCFLALRNLAVQLVSGCSFALPSLTKCFLCAKPLRSNLYALSHRQFCVIITLLLNFIDEETKNPVGFLWSLVRGPKKLIYDRVRTQQPLCYIIEFLLQSLTIF